MAQRIFAPNIRPTKNPPVRPYFKNKKNTKKDCCSFSARKHPTPPGTGTEPGSASGLGAAPAPGTRQFSQALLAVGPPVGRDPREKKPGKPQVRTRPRFCFFSEVSFLGRVFEGRFHPGRNVWTMGRRDRHTVPVGTRPTETPLLFPSDGHTNR